MKLRILTIGLVAAVLLPAAAFADAATASDKANGARACQALRTSLGEATFNSSYGTNADKSNAFGKCVSKWTRLEHQNRNEAERRVQGGAGRRRLRSGARRQDLRPVLRERQEGRERPPCAASSRSGTPRPCVDRQATVNAARSCKAERKELGTTAFVAKYGTKANAFGKCVSTLAHAHHG